MSQRVIDALNNRLQMEKMHNEDPVQVGILSRGLGGSNYLSTIVVVKRRSLVVIVNVTA